VTEEKERVAQQLTRAQGLAKLVGSDPAFRAAIDLTATAADADAPVLITGETGTGKELKPRALSTISVRALRVLSSPSIVGP
jgi:DNA-binding NtrC family response regulator